jgi:tol-pal system protein YbgF
VAFFAIFGVEVYDSIVRLNVRGWGAGALASIVWLGGCAGVPRAEVDDMNRKLDGYRRQSERDRKHIDELENRVYVLEDKIDTQTVSQGKTEGYAPRLPVVKKRPAADAQAPAAPAPAEGGATLSERYTDADGEDVLVIYEGDAAKKGGGARVSLVGTPDAAPADGDSLAARSGPRARRPKRDGATAAEATPPTSGAVDRLPVQKDIPPPPAAAPGASDPLTLYKSSYAALTRREHATAIAGFQRFLELYPDHDYADNAQYWLGEAYYDQRDFQTALGEFRKVVKRYPDGNKAPDALLKIGYCYARLNDLDSARDVLSQVIEIYPKTEAAKLAAKRLDEMRQ